MKHLVGHDIHAPATSPIAEIREGPEGGETRPRTAISSTPFARDLSVTLCAVSHWFTDRESSSQYCTRGQASP